MNLGITPDHEGGQWHWPRYTKGCWGKPHVPSCPICKIRFGWWMLKGLIGYA